MRMSKEMNGVQGNNEAMNKYPTILPPLAAYLLFTR